MFGAELAALLSERELELLKKNFQSVVYEPKVAAAAYAIAAVLDRIRVGTVPAGRRGIFFGSRWRRWRAVWRRSRMRGRSFMRGWRMLIRRRQRAEFMRRLRWGGLRSGDRFWLQLGATVAELFRPSVVVLAAAVILDLLLGDPVYPLHPIRLMGHTLALV